MSFEFATVFTGPIEAAKVVQALLSAQGFHASLTQDFAIGSDAGVDSGFFGSYGVGVLVPRAEAEAAMSCLVEGRAAGAALGEDDTDAARDPSADGGPNDQGLANGSSTTAG